MTSVPRESVAVVVKTLELGGAEKQSILITKALQDINPTVLLVRNGDMISDRFRGLAQRYDIELVTLHGGAVRRFVDSVRVIRSRNVSTLIALLPSDNLWSAAVKHVAGVRHIVGSIRGLLLRGPKFYAIRALSRYLFDGMVFNSDAALQHYADLGFRRDTLVHIPNAIDAPPEWTSERETGRFDVLMVGRFDAAKDYHTALKGFKLFMSSTPDTITRRLIIAGYGPLCQEIRDEIRRLDLDRHVVLVLPHDPTIWYRTCHAYLSSSIYEGMSNAILEAMAFGLPVVATDVGDSGRMVHHERTGLLVEPDDPHAISDSLSTLLSNAETAKEYGTRGREVVERDYTLESLSKSYGRLLLCLSANSPVSAISTSSASAHHELNVAGQE